MKRIGLILLCFVLICGIALGESPATPTDLEEVYEIFEDDDYGYIDFDLIDRQVFVEFLKNPTYLGEEVTLVAILINFLPTDIYTFEWQYSLDQDTWFILENEHQQTYTFVLTTENCAYWWRVKVTIED